MIADEKRASRKAGSFLAVNEKISFVELFVF